VIVPYLRPSVQYLALGFDPVPQLRSTSHAAIEQTNPSTAKDACMTAARRHVRTMGAAETRFTSVSKNDKASMPR
jgi:hypothetical protein